MKKIPFLYLLFFMLVIPAWLVYMLHTNSFGLYHTYWKSALTMFFGSFIAGATSEGGGAVAFPVFTLVLNLTSAVARNFSFAIQSIGMTAASLLIISMKMKVDWKAIRLTTLGGIPGLLTGMFFIAPLISSATTKIFFVSLWLSFAFALYLVNRNTRRKIYDKLRNLVPGDVARIILFGFVGGIITSVFGDGINIFTFCLFTLYYNMNEKVATSGSVIIMTIHTIIGTVAHVFIIRDFQPVTLNYWLCAVPVAILMAPLGAYIIHFLSRKVILNFFYIVSLAQYIGALVVLRPKPPVLILSVAVLASGFAFFWNLSKKARQQAVMQTVPVATKNKRFLQPQMKVVAGMGYKKIPQ